MKVKGKELVVCNSTVLKLKRGGEYFPITVTAFRPGFLSRMQAVGILDWGEPPKKLMVRNKRPVFNEDGSPAVEVFDQDPEYVKRRMQCVRRYQALKVAEALRDDTTIEFDAKPPEGYDRAAWEAYADALNKEITDEHSGLTDAEVETILSWAEKLEGQIDVMAAHDDFLPESQ